MGKNAWTLQIHNGKAHSQSIDCGLCDFPAKDLETLNLHLKTFKMYECDQCEHVAKHFQYQEAHKY